MFDPHIPKSNLSGRWGPFVHSFDFFSSCLNGITLGQAETDYYTKPIDRNNQLNVKYIRCERVIWDLQS